MSADKPTSQSSDGWSSDGFGSAQAVDGNAATMQPPGCTQTSTQDDPWWQVDMQTSQDVSIVRVTNRGDCCGTRLDMFTIKVGDQECGANLVVPQGETGDFVCNPPLAGSTVRIELPGKNRMLTVLPATDRST